MSGLKPYCHQYPAVLLQPIVRHRCKGIEHSVHSERLACWHCLYVPFRAKSLSAQWMCRQTCASAGYTHSLHMGPCTAWLAMSVSFRSQISIEVLALAVCKQL